MGHYLGLCSDRLAEMGRIDGEDTAMNVCDFPDLLFTSDGLSDCLDILENYLPFDMLADARQRLTEAEREDKRINRMAADFRTMKGWKLLKYYVKLRSCKAKEEAEQEARQLVCRWILTELWSRSVFSRIWRQTREAVTRLFVKWKYRRLFDRVRTGTEKGE